MWIDRHLSAQVLSAAEQFPALVITGGRQTGKTTLLRHLFPAASFASLGRDTHGTEVDFVIEQNARVRLIEAKWAEIVGDPRGLKPLLTVRDLLGDQAASEHWVACRTPHPHALAGVPGVRLINAASFDGWFG